MNKKHLPGALVGSHGCYILGCVNTSTPFYFSTWQTQKTTPLILSAHLFAGLDLICVGGKEGQEPGLNFANS